jgi:hypothetical protein
MSVSTITPANIVGMGAEGIAETLVVGLLTSQGGIDSLLVANGGQVNGTVRAGFLDDGEKPDRPRITVNVIEDETDFSRHPKLADVTVSVTLETWARGLASATARADGDHVGTDAVDGEKMRQTIREALCDQDAWTTYLGELQTALGETVLGFTIRTLKIETGGTEEGEDPNTRIFQTRLRMLLEASETWADVVIPGSLAVGTYVAAEAISGGRFIYFTSDGEIGLARSSDPDKPAQGFINAAVSSGASVAVFSEGKLQGLSGIETGDSYFLSDSGTPTLTPPATGIVQSVGVGVDSSALDVELAQPMTRA